ncbi:MAG: DUF4190 domain-containing protein [Phycisphaerales bacterium]|nr:DUF4190 domain-containing protein [Phycisphaerales bacterium]
MTSFSAPAGDRDFDWGPQRTSILAILALVFALPCFIPGVGFIASLLAVFALVGIASSKGRVGGTGLAVAALVLGLISTAFWGALGYGAWQMVNKFSSAATAPVAAIITAAQKGEFQNARDGMISYSAEKLTDERLAAFQTEVNDKLGAYQSAPKGLFDLISAYGEISHLMKAPPQNGDPQIPLPLRFEKGAALVLLEIDPTKQHEADTKKSKSLPIRNFMIVAADGTVIQLLDPALLPKSTWNGNIQIDSGGKVRAKEKGEPVIITPDEQPAFEPAATPVEPKKPGGA